MGMIASVPIQVENKILSVPNDGILIIDTLHNSFTMEFESGIWDELSVREICISVNDTFTSIPLVNNQYTIPSNIITANDQQTVYVGVLGKNSDATNIYPTPYYRLGLIRV